MIEVAKLLGVNWKQTSTGKDWCETLVEVQRYDFKTRDHGPAPLLLKCFGRAAGDCKGLTRGQVVKVSYVVTSREYNDKYYTDAVCEGVSAEGETAWRERPAPAERPVPDNYGSVDDDITF